MGVADVTDTGRGRIAFSLRIEGDPWEWCDAQQLVGTSTSGGFTRVSGLDSTALEIEEEPDVIEAKLGAKPISISIMGPEANERFSRRPSIRTYLTTDLPIGGTTMEVLSTAGITVGMYLNVNTETVLVDNVIDGTQLTVSRAKFDTIDQRHWAPDGLTAGLTRPLVTDRPFVRERRRVRIYWYGDAEIESGTATQFWIGVLAKDPVRESDGLTWRLTISPLSELFETDLGTDLADEMALRGAMYNNGNALTVFIDQLTGADYDDPRDPAFSITVNIGSTTTGLPEFFETNEDFVAELNDRIQTAAGGFAGWDGSVVAVVRPDDGWGFTVDITAGPSYIRVTAVSTLDGTTDTIHLFEQPAHTAVFAVALGTTYSVDWLDGSAAPGARQLPRGSFYVPPPPGSRSGRNALWIAIAGGVDITLLAALQIEWPDGDLVTHRVVDTDVALGLVELDYGTVAGSRTPADYHEYIGESPTMKAIRLYAAGSLYDFVNAIVGASAESANRGSVPFITAHDVVLTDIAATVAECARDMLWATARLYAQSGPITLADWLAEEAKLIGAFWCLAADGRITLRPLRLRAPTDLATDTIIEADPDVAEPNGDLLNDAGIPQWEPHAMGLVNTVDVKTGYDSLSEEWAGRPIRIISAQAIGETKAGKILGIAPYSLPLTTPSWPVYFEQVAQLAERVIGMFGAEYAILSVEVPLSKFGLLVGDTVRLTSSTVPDPDTGENGVEDLMCIVLGRRWEPLAAAGVLTLFVTNQRIAGYAPALRIVSQVEVGNPAANVWHLTVDTGFLADGDTISNHFQKNERIQVSRFDDVTPGTIQGSVSSATEPDTIRVVLASTWTPGADAWDLETADADHASLIARQQLYAFVAQDDGWIPFASGDVPAQTFATG